MLCKASGVASWPSSAEATSPGSRLVPKNSNADTANSVSRPSPARSASNRVMASSRLQPHLFAEPLSHHVEDGGRAPTLHTLGTGFDVIHEHRDERAAVLGDHLLTGAVELATPGGVSFRPRLVRELVKSRAAPVRIVRAGGGAVCLRQGSLHGRSAVRVGSAERCLLINVRPIAIGRLSSHLERDSSASRRGLEKNPDIERAGERGFRGL